MVKIARNDLIALFATIVVGLLALVIMSGRTPLWAPPATVADIPASTTKQMLAELEVRTQDSGEKYERVKFGDSWADQDGNGCDTRNDVLQRDLQEPVLDGQVIPRCKVLSGVLDDPYTGKTVQFKRGKEASKAVQIDHVVALGDAWRSGAWAWSASQRVAFANDQRNLLAVDGKQNEDKGAKTADQWLPMAKEYHCSYVARQVAVKWLWGLSVTGPERQTMIDVLSSCPAMDLIDLPATRP